MANLNRKINFILQQGLSAPPAETCSSTYSGLLFQGRLIAVVAIVGTVAQSASIFVSLAALLWWSAAFPRWNPFDIVYNRLFAAKSGFQLQPAPAPRRFAQTLAGTLCLLIAALVIFHHGVAALLVEVIFLGAIAALGFGGFCVGSYAFHVLTGKRKFANGTLPWSPPPDSTVHRT